MRDTYLEVTYRHGRPVAAYYYLPRQSGDRAARTRQVDPGLVIDYAGDGRAIGIEITAPSKVSAHTLNAVLRDLGHADVSDADLAPLKAA